MIGDGAIRDGAYALQIFHLSMHEVQVRAEVGVSGQIKWEERSRGKGAQLATMELRRY